jgi:16S rRNA (guanine966-N2)-methyltransferase
MLDSSPAVVAQLRQNISLLGLKQVRVEQADAISWLQTPAQQFDIVFLDPPFADGLLQQACQSLAAGKWLRPDALVYLETDAVAGLPELPPALRILKEKKAGQVAYCLCSNG